MKYYALILLFIVLGFNTANAQVLNQDNNSSQQELYEFHMGKRKTNNTIGGLTLGGGLAMFTIGYLTYLDKCLLSNCNNEGLALTIIGSATTLSSIYFFIKADKHKKQAAIHLKNGAVGLNREVKHTGLSVSLTF